MIAPGLPPLSAQTIEVTDIAAQRGRFQRRISCNISGGYGTVFEPLLGLLTWGNAA
jgi:hypothetical protein